MWAGGPWIEPNIKEGDRVVLFNLHGELDVLVLLVDVLEELVEFLSVVWHIAACSCLLMLGFGGLAVERACATLGRILSAAALSRTWSLGSTCWMTCEKEIFVGSMG